MIYVDRKIQTANRNHLQVDCLRQTGGGQILGENLGLGLLSLYAEAK